MSQSPSATTSGNEQKRIADLPTPDHTVPGLTDLSELRPGDRIVLDSHATPLTVQFVGVRTKSTLQGTTQQYAIEAEHDRANAVTHDLYEQYNLADGSVIQIVDGRGRPVRVFEGDP